MKLRVSSPPEVTRGRDTAAGLPSASTSGARQQRLSSVSKGKARPVPVQQRAAPQTPRTSIRGVRRSMESCNVTPSHTKDHNHSAANSSRDKDTPTELSPTSSTAANLSSAATEEATLSDSFSSTKILLKASEMIHNEVRYCEERLAARYEDMFQQERKDVNLKIEALKKDVEEMLTVVETFASQMHKSPSDPRLDGLDSFFEQEKRARDALREEFEGLADQVSALEEDRQKDSPGVSLAEVSSMLENERAAWNSSYNALRKDLDQERSDRDLSNAVLRKDLKNQVDALATVPSQTESSLNEAQLKEILDMQQTTVQATCSELRAEIKALSMASVAVTSLSPALPVSPSKARTGGTGNCEEELSSPGGIAALTDLQHIVDRLQQQHKDEVDQVEERTEQLRSDFASTSQVVHLHLERVDQAISDLQWDMRAAQVRDLAPTTMAPRANGALQLLTSVICGGQKNG